MLCVWLGEKVLVDGVVFDGESYIDEVMFIGELMLVVKVVGDVFIGGMVN